MKAKTNLVVVLITISSLLSGAASPLTAVPMRAAAYVEPAQCHGCGICTSECPAKAIQLMHYKDSQIISKTMALFQDTGKVS